MQANNSAKTHDKIGLSSLHWQVLNEHQINCTMDNDTHKSLLVCTPAMEVPYGLEMGGEMRFLLSDCPGFRTWILNLEKRMKRLPHFFPDFFLNNYNDKVDQGLIFRSNLRNHAHHGTDSLLLASLPPKKKGNQQQQQQQHTQDQGQGQGHVPCGSKVRAVLRMVPVWNYDSHFGYLWQIEDMESVKIP